MNNSRTKSGPGTILKWVGVLVLVLAYLLISGLLTVLPLSSRLVRRMRMRTTSRFSRMALFLLGIRVRSKLRNRPTGKGPGRLVIANHVSYVDILLVSSLMPAVFVTSVEMKHTRLLGMLAKFGGSLFVERRRPAGLRQEIAEIAQVLGQGCTVVLFPEGTTSNGDRVLPFKRSLFDAAVESGADILPLCIRYRKIDNRPITHDNRDRLYYYGGTAFSSHFPRFLSLQSIDVEVTALKTIRVHDHGSRKELALLAHELVSTAYLA